MKCIIIDDEPLAREELQILINEVSNLEIIGDFSAARSALDFIQKNQVDLIFLDIQMPGISGLEFAEKVAGNTLIIFTTAYSKYAVKCFEFDALDYILKPVNSTRLKKAIDKAFTYSRLLSLNTAKSEIEEAGNEFLIIKAERRFYKVLFSEIRYIEGLKDYVIIHTHNQKLITAMNLKSVYQKLPCNLFIRVSKSYIVNFNYVISFDHYSIFVEEQEIPLGEVFKKDFFSRYSAGLLSGK